MKNYLIYIFIFLLFIFSVNAYDQVIEYDDNDDIYYTTTVYRLGQPYNESVCNFTIFNPAPNENFINLSILLDNKGNGIYSYNLTGLLRFNKNPYPISIFCNDTFGIYGSEGRSAIKIGESMFDYTAAGLILLGLAITLMVVSFKLDEQNYEMKYLSFFGSMGFFISTLFYGLFIINKIPNNTGFVAVFEVTITIFLLMTAIFVWMFFKGHLERMLSYFTGTSRK